MDIDIGDVRRAQLHRDAPTPPEGYMPRVGVEYGCGAVCEACYELEPPVVQTITKVERVDR